MFPNEVSLTKVGSWKWLQEEMMMVNISVEQNILTLLIRRFCTAFFFFLNILLYVYQCGEIATHREPDAFLRVMKSCNLIYNHSFSPLASF